MDKLLGWLRRFDHVTFVSRSHRSTGLWVALRTGWSVVRQLGLLALIFAWYGLAPSLGVDSGLVFMIGALLILGFVLGLGRRRFRLADKMLVQAASRAAMQLGSESAPGQWQISGPQAGDVWRELNRLNRLPWPLPTGGDQAVAREEQLLAEAGPQLRPFIAPVLTRGEGYEPPAVEATPIEPGAPWPQLNARPDQPEESA